MAVCRPRIKLCLFPAATLHKVVVLEGQHHVPLTLVTDSVSVFVINNCNRYPGKRKEKNNKTKLSLNWCRADVPTGLT